MKIIQPVLLIGLVSLAIANLYIDVLGEDQFVTTFGEGAGPVPKGDSCSK